MRAASNRAALKPTRPTITNGRLKAKGTLSTMARGVVRLQVLYEPPGQQTRTLEFTAKINKGSYSFDEKLDANTLAGIGQRRGGVHSYTLFTGSLPARMRGEMRSYQVLGNR